jgi:ribosomal protein S15P/S13E
VLGQQGLYIDKIALEAGARDFDLEQLIENANALHEHVKKHGEVKF